MALNLLIQPELPKERKNFKPVSPTLLVGIGGTGKEILLRFRRLVVERYGSLGVLPFIQYVHMDTDRTRAAQEQYDVKSEDDPLYTKLRFMPSERVSLTIDGGTGKYVEHINRFPNIKRWFEAKGKIASMGDLEEGAGQFRMASRLGFFHSQNFGNLTSRLDQAAGALRDAANQKAASELGFELDASQIEIVVVASLAGGTGGGVFLDMGYLLAKVFPGASRIGLFLLPNFFRGYAGATRVRANGYAALTELNYYSFGHFFLGDWDAANPSFFPPPPYGNTYLIDATNEAGLEIGSSGKEFDIYGMVSEFLFQDFSIGSFSGMKRATRVNLEQFNLNVYTHNFLNVELDQQSTDERNLVGDTYPTRFGSFGLAGISFPTDRVHNACACRLASKILESWETTLQEDPLEQLFTSFLVDPAVSFAQGRYELKDRSGIVEEMQIEDALLWYDRPSGNTFTSHIWERAQSIRSEIDAAPKGQKGAVLSQHRSQVDQLMAKEDSAHPEEWGQWVRIVDENARSYLRDVKAGIRKKAEEVANDREHGVAVALALLHELKSLLRNEIFLYMKYFDDSFETWQAETTRFASDLDRLQLDVEHHDRQMLFRKADLERDLDLLVAVDSDQEELGAVYNYLYSRVMKQVAKRGKYICEEVDVFLGKDDPTGKGLISEYYQLLGGFHQLRGRLEEKERYYSGEPRSELTISLFRHGDVDEWYKTWVGDPPTERQVWKRVGNELLSSIFGVASVTQALDYIRSTKTEEVEDQVFAHCKDFFARQEEQPQALQMLLDGSRFSRSDTESKVRLAYNLGKVWMARAQRGLEHTDLPHVRADQRPCLIGIDTDDKARYKEFQELIGRIQAAGDSPPAFLNIGKANRGMIIFYNELAGVPAFYGSSVSAAQGMKESYRNYRDKGELHTDRNRFQFGELIPKTSGEAKRYADSLRAFVLARLLGLLKTQVQRDRETNEVTFRYSYRKEDMLQVEEVLLGDELSAIDILYRDSRPDHTTDRAQLLRQVEEVLDTLKVKGELSVYALLLEFYKKMVYPPTADTEWIKSLTIYQFSPQYAVLEQATRNIEMLVPEERDLEQLRVALAQLKGNKVGDLNHDEYVLALEPYCKFSGKYEVTSIGAAGVRKMSYENALVLDLAKIDDQRFESYDDTKSSFRPPSKASTPEPETVATRSCPDCGGEIDTRAVFCKHCKNTVTQHVTCPHCGEEKVPGDLEKCWKCGRGMPSSEEEKIECPHCFNFKGLEHEFPCPVCGYHPDGTPPPASESEDTWAAPAEPEERTRPPIPIPMAEPAEPAAAAVSGDLVQCPNCFEQVEPGPICSVCGNQLETE